MALQLKYKGQTGVPVEVEGLTPTALRGMPLAEIEKQTIFHGNQQLPLAEFFDVSGDAADLRMEWQGDLAGVHWIGAKMSEGEVHVAGNAGRHVGSEMTGGEIHVAGDAGDWVGGEMHGGLIHVRGRAGHLIGAAYRGSARGMTGGILLVGGAAGNEVGHTMRRGFLAIGGSCGDFPAINMIAGTLLVFGGCGIRAAAGMRRGTLAVFGDRPPLLPTFRAGGVCRPSFLPLYLRKLARLNFAFPGELMDAELAIYHGDLVTTGLGEVLMRAS
jgi:formylmethanofuran dehydrogenase subunit C